MARLDFDPKTRLGECKACGLVIELMAVPPAVKRVEASLAKATIARPIVTQRRRVALPAKIELEIDATESPLPKDAIATDGPMMPYREAAREIAEDGTLKRVIRSEARVVLRVKEGPKRAVSDIMGVFFIAGLFALSDCFCNSAASHRPLTEYQNTARIALEYILIPLAITAFVWVLSAAIVNTRTIRLENGVLRIAYGPIPRGGNVSVRAEDIEQIWTRRTVEETAGNKRPDYHIAYNLEARLRGGGGGGGTTEAGKAKSIVLIRSLNDRDQGLFIEQTLEHALGIVDVAVADEDVTDPFLR